MTIDKHSVSVVCRVSAQQALDFLADGLRLGQWAMGCWRTEAVGGGVVRGHSLFDDQFSFVRPVLDEEKQTVVYHVGSAPDALHPRISATVEPGSAIGQNDGVCRITLHASRTGGMDDARWLRLVRCHEVEVLLIQARLDEKFFHPTPRKKS